MIHVYKYNETGHSITFYENVSPSAFRILNDIFEYVLMINGLLPYED